MTEHPTGLERVERIRKRDLYTNRNKGVDVLVNKLDLVALLAEVEQAEQRIREL